MLGIYKIIGGIGLMVLVIGVLMSISKYKIARIISGVGTFLVIFWAIEFISNPYNLGYWSLFLSIPIGIASALLTYKSMQCIHDDIVHDNKENNNVK